MEQHDFIAGPNGFCEVCSKTRKECVLTSEIYITGLPEAVGMQVNKAIIFFEQIPESCKAQQISCTKFNTFILSTSGHVFSWGETTNALGRVLEKRDDAKIPKQIYELRNSYIVSLACGESHVLALDYTKNIWSWGFNKFGQLGHGDASDRNLPQMIESIKGIVKVAAAANFSYGVSENGRVYAWGDNKNFQLGQMVDEDGAKQSRFLRPKLIENSPWDKTANIEVGGGNGNNFFFKSQNKGKQGGGASKIELQRCKLENEELKRRLEFLTKKIAILEEELYKNNPDLNPQYGLTQDTALQEMQALLKRNTQKIEETERNVRDYDEEILIVSKEVEEIEKIITDLDAKEAMYWDEIEEKDNDLNKLQGKKGKEASKISDLKNKRENLQDFIKTIENTRSTYYADLNNKQDLLEDSTNNKTSACTELIELQKRDVLYKMMISSRDRELQYTFFDKKQENVDHNIISVLKIHEALKETSLDCIAKSIISSSVTQFIATSNQLLDRIKSEIISLKHNAKKSPFKSLASLWEILEDNISLRLQINNYTEGLLMQTANQLYDYHDSAVDRESKMYISAIEYAKQVLHLGNLKTKDEDQVLFADKRKGSPIRSRKAIGTKWRFC